MSNSLFSTLAPDLDSVIGTGFSLAGCATGIVCGVYRGLLSGTGHLNVSPKVVGAGGGRSQAPPPFGGTGQDNDEHNDVHDSSSCSSASSFLKSSEASTSSFSSSTSSSSSDDSHEETGSPSTAQDSKPQPQQQQRRRRAWLPTRCIVAAARLCPGSRLLRSVVRKTDCSCKNIGKPKTQADGATAHHLTLVLCPSTCDQKQRLTRARHLLSQAKDLIDHGTAVSADEAVSENQLVLDLCNEGIQLDVDDAETCARLYHNRGIAKYCLGHLMGALFDCCMSVKTCPQAWQPYSLRGLLYEEIGEYKLAVKDYEACLQRGGAPDMVHTVLLSLKQPCLQSNKILQIDPNLTEFEQKALAPGAFRKLARQFHPDKVPEQQKEIACVVFNYLKQAASSFR